MCRLVAVSALVVALTVALTGAASAQAMPFQASVTSTLVRGGGTLPSGACSNGAYSCGTANIAGYGAASWNLYVTNYAPVPTSCGSTYTATTYFTLASDRSTLVLNESGNLCAPGLNGNGYFMDGAKAYGHPFSGLGSWTIDTADSTGVFGSLTGGMGTGGTDTLQFDGAHAAGEYSGTLG
jgi:hypothetical protein